MSDPISDLLTRIRNGQSARLDSINIPSSKIKEQLCKVLLEEGYIDSFSVIDVGPKKTLNVKLKYFNDKPVIETIKRKSKPSKRIYCSAKNIPKIKGGLGVAILSTSRGLMTDKIARKNNFGGEIICIVS